MSFEQKLLRSVQHQIDNEEAAAERWRRVLLKLSTNLNAASAERSDLSPVLMEALHHALENLLLLGDEADLLALEEWVDVEHDRFPAPITREEAREQRYGERRISTERRCAERRVNSHFPTQTSGENGDANGNSLNGASAHPDILRERRQNSDRRQNSADRRTGSDRRSS